jgi:hypothetical protein
VCRGQNPIPIMLCLARMIEALFPGGQFAIAHRRDRFPCSRRCMPSWHCIRVWEPVKLKRRLQKKLRTVTGAVISRMDFALIHDRGMKRQKARRREAYMRPHDRGSRETDAVSNSSAIDPRARLNSRVFRQGQAVAKVTGSS